MPASHGRKGFSIMAPHRAHQDVRTRRPSPVPWRRGTAAPPSTGVCWRRPGWHACTDVKPWRSASSGPLSLSHVGETRYSPGHRLSMKCFIACAVPASPCGDNWAPAHAGKSRRPCPSLGMAQDARPQASVTRSRNATPDQAAVPPRIMSASFSPIMMHAALVLPETSVGMIDASATRNPPTP